MKKNEGHFVDVFEGISTTGFRMDFPWFSWLVESAMQWWRPSASGSFLKLVHNPLSGSCQNSCTWDDLQQHQLKHLNRISKNIPKPPETLETLWLMDVDGFIMLPSWVFIPDPSSSAGSHGFLQPHPDATPRGSAWAAASTKEGSALVSDGFAWPVRQQVIKILLYTWPPKNTQSETRTCMAKSMSLKELPVKKNVFGSSAAEESFQENVNNGLWMETQHSTRIKQWQLSKSMQCPETGPWPAVLRLILLEWSGTDLGEKDLQMNCRQDTHQKHSPLFQKQRMFLVPLWFSTAVSYSTDCPL